MTDITPQQRRYARLAGVVILAKFVLESFGDGITIISRGNASFAETASFATQSAVLWRFSLLTVGLAWIAISIQGFALYAVLEPVHRRLAQLALVLRLGASFVGAASLMFRVAITRIYKATETPDLFTIEQLRTFAGVLQRGANAGVWLAWILLGAGAMLSFLLFLRSRYLPRALAWLGIVGSIFLVAVSGVMFVFPEGNNWMKMFCAPLLLAELVTAVWLLKGIRPPRAEVH